MWTLHGFPAHNVAQIAVAFGFFLVCLILLRRLGNWHAKSLILALLLVAIVGPPIWFLIEYRVWIENLDDDQYPAMGELPPNVIQIRPHSHASPYNTALAGQQLEQLVWASSMVGLGTLNILAGKRRAGTPNNTSNQ